MTDTRVSILLVGERDWQSRIIQLATHGAYNHCGVQMDDGTLIQAISSGVVRTDPPYYTTAATQTITFPVDAEDKAAADRWLLSTVGNRYDVWNIVAFGVNLLTDGRVIFGETNRYICSALATKYLQLAGYPFYDDPHSVSPNDLARLAAAERAIATRQAGDEARGGA